MPSSRSLTSGIAPLFRHVTDALDAKGLGLAITILVTNAMTEPLASDAKDVFGNVLWYHPVTVWVVIVAIVGLQTKSVTTGVVVVLLYEALKYVWRVLRLEAPAVCRMRKVLSRCQRGEDMDDDDIAFIDAVTPPDVKVARQATGARKVGL